MSNPTYDPLYWPSEVPEADLVLAFTCEFQPLSKGRPRFTRKGIPYTDKRTRKYEQDVAMILKSHLRDDVDGASRFGLRCVFHRANRQRIDCDNLIKAISDAATGIVWKDDSQVLEVIGRLFLGSSSPRTEVAIYRVPDTFPYDLCAECGKEFTRPPSQKSPFCSVDCFRESKRVTKNCLQCGIEFRTAQCRTKGRFVKFCSRKCTSTYYGNLKSIERGPSTWKCMDCGGPVSRPEYKRCNACRQIQVQTPTPNNPKKAYDKDGNLKQFADGRALKTRLRNAAQSGLFELEKTG